MTEKRKKQPSIETKNVLKPTALNAAILVILLVASSIPSNILVQGADIGANHGFPLNFYGYGGGPGLLSGQPIPQYLNVIAFIVDVAVWYAVACLLAWAYKKR